MAYVMALQQGWPTDNLAFQSKSFQVLPVPLIASEQSMF
jgi:hypothetical protein